MGISTAVFLLVGIIGTGAVVVILQRKLQPSGPVAGAIPRRTPATRKPQAAAQTPVTGLNPYRAISIVSGDNPCGAVKALDGTLFLVEDRDAPALPLTVCDAQKCDCKYRHHVDRRDDDDDRRTIAASLRTELHNQSGNEERRYRRGRRRADFDD